MSPQVVEQLGEVPKFSSHGRSLQRAVEQIADVYVPQMGKQFVVVPKIESQDRIQHRTVGQIVDIPAPKVVEGLVDVSRIFSKERITERIVEQIFCSEQLVDVLVTQKEFSSQERAQEPTVGYAPVSHTRDEVGPS